MSLFLVKFLHYVIMSGASFVSVFYADFMPRTLAKYSLILF